MAARGRAAPIGEDVPAATDPLDHEPASEELAALWRLGLDHVRRRWRTLVGRPMPSGLGRQLTLRILAYHEQVLRHGDLDKASRRALAETTVGTHGGEMSVGPRACTATPIGRDTKEADASKPVRAPDLLRPGTVLAREHGGVLHRVLVGPDGFTWQGRRYNSLSKVAFAITGTRWNGPRFFGLRDGPALTKGGKRQGRPKASAATVKTVIGRGRASVSARSTSLDAMP